tara:strand:- start:3460 stop:4617 length:1158 start_codon:yes stop_codon:yes gene_type:complete
MISFKYRIYPNKEQEQKLSATLSTCRHTYNNALEERVNAYKKDKTSLSYVDQAKLLTKNKNEYQKKVFTQVLQSTLRRLDVSFKRFFKVKIKGKRIGYPRFKSENRFRSFCYPQHGFKILNDGSHIKLSKIGDIKLRYSRPTEGKIKTCIVLKDVDQWFIIIACEQDEYNVASNKPTIGIDVGIKQLATLSDGNIIGNPKHLIKSQKKLARQQRWLSRKKKGSKNRNKQRIKVAKVHRKIRRQRDDFLHKTSHYLSNNYGTIVFEELNIGGMLKNHCLAKAISDASWYKLMQLTTYKAAKAGSVVEFVDATNTTQNCSSCGKKVKKELKDRIHNCPHCGLVMCRDLNAAKNIKSRAGSVRTNNAHGDIVRPNASLNRQGSIGSCR